MMAFICIVVVFVLGYTAIALEHPLKVNKAASALLTGMLIWTLIAVAGLAGPHPDEVVAHHLGGIASILFFLLGAMVVVELMDAHAAFQVITDRITTTDKRKLFWIIGLVTFFLSAVLDNLTTSIVMCALLRKLLRDKSDLWLFAGMVVIAANAGGAWSPIGDVTTIMLWIDGQVTGDNIVRKLIVPSLVCLLVPLLWMTRSLKGRVERPDGGTIGLGNSVKPGQRMAVFLLGLATLLGVPLFKQLTHLPPFVGVMLGLGVLWTYTEFVHAGAEVEAKGQLSVTGILQRIDHGSVLFFLGILIAVSGLETAGHLTLLSAKLTAALGDDLIAINTLIGLLSAVVDNVPLVAAAQGMYPLSHFPQDHLFWELLAFCAGTGGSLLIIGSAAGVAVMGVLGIEFGWYVKRIAFPAALGYFAGIVTFWLLWV